MKNEEKTKKLGQVFTPERIVKIMLDEAGFDRTNVLVFKIMEPSFGKGVFLIEIIKRIIRKGRDFNYSKKQIENIIEENVYGIEVDEELFDETINSIKLLLANNNLNTDLDFKLFNEDSIKI
jgi:type I restriction-modification system DNA methylase subunit